MDCPGCAHANREAAKFCAQCATPLPAACPSCGSELSGGARFCDQCGTRVAVWPGAASADDRATRKVVTVLFADLVGSTAFGEQVDAESAREAMAEYHAMAAAAVESAGGTIAKFIGDGVMALFGVPETAEDDADRAVRAGLALQAGFAPMRERVARRHGAELGLRVGINTGEIVLADGDADLVGDAINTAARLEAACTPGHVLVGEDTWRLTRSHVRYEVLGEVAVKGKDEPVATFRVADDEVHDDDPATPFVGRSDELMLLRALFDDAVAARSARFATVIGAPGVGKSRIAREFADSLGELAAVAELRCERAGTATFAPVADLLRSITTIDGEADADQGRAALRDLVAELDDADRVAELLASFVGAAPVRSTEEAFLAVRRLVEAVGRRQPLVIVVDDIQWAEPLFLDLLEHLADWVRDAPAFLVGLARPELRELRPSLAEEGRTVAASIGLEGLDAEATAELAARLVGADSLPAELVARLPHSTEGNPLFVRELMRMLVDDGVIEETSTGWQLTIDADAVEVPPTIQSLLAARLDRMPNDERRLVELASVVGPEFALGAVAEISDEGAADVRRALDRLRRRELVESTGMYWGDEPVFRFHHVLIRDAAYRRLLKRARADLHLQVGEWTERTAADLPGEHEVAIAYHFEQAHEYHRQLDDVDDAMAAVGRRAAELLGAAAERSLERDDLPAAAALAERSLARVDDGGDALIPSMLVIAAEALLGLGDVGRGRPVVERLAEVVADDPRLAPWADAFVAQLTMLTEPDRLHDADDRAERAATRLAELGDEAGVAKARLVRAGALARLGQVGQCETELDQALTAARSAGDRRRVAAVLGAAPLAALWGPSPIPRAGGRCLDVIRLLRITTGSPAVEATSVRCQAVLEALRGRFDTARSMLGDSRATVEELGLRHALGETDLFAGIVELLAGDPEAAEGHLRSAYQGLGRLGIGADAGQAAAYLARAVLRQGRVDEAEALAAESADGAGENPQTAIAARTAQAEILSARGRYDAAVSVAREAVARAEGTDIIVDHAAASAVLAKVAELAGDAATADRAARTAAALYEQKAATVRVDRAAVGPTADLASTPGEDAASSSNPVGEPWNEADRLSRLAIERGFDPTRGSFEGSLAPDHVSEDRRPIVGYRTEGRQPTLEMWGSSRPSGTEDLTSTIETVAARGEHLVLYRLTVARGAARFDFLELSRWDGEGLCDLAIRFDVDQLAEAIDELDRRYLDSVDPSSCAAFQVRAYGLAYRALRHGELDRAMDVLSRRYVQRDHRSLGWPTVDWAGMRERLSTMGSAGDLLPFLSRVHRLDGPVALCQSEVRVIGEQGAEQIDRHLLVSVLDLETGQAGSVDQFALDQMDEAAGKFVESVAEVAGRDVRWNAASLVGGWLATASRLGRADLVSDLVATGSDAPSAVDRREVLAVRGDRLALVARVDGQSVPVGFVLEELGRDGRLVSVEEYAPDDLIGAAGRCDRRPLELMSDPTMVDQLLADYLIAWRARDIDRLAQLLDESFRAVDRRPLGSPELDKQGQLAALESLAATDDLPLQTHDWFVRGDRGMVAPFTVVGRDDDRRLTESLLSIVVCVVRDGRIVRNELFPIEQRALAITRFHELTGATRPVEHLPRNDADRLTRRFIASFTAGAREEWLPMLSPDQVTIDRRPLVGVDTVGAGGVADAYPRNRESGELSSAVETFAVRGESFALVRWKASSTHGREWDGFHLTRWNDDGQNDLNVIFPPDQLDEALAELDRLYLAGAPEPSDRSHEPGGASGPAEHEPWNEADRLAREGIAMFFDPTADGFDATIAADHVSEDRRPIVGYRTEGRDDMLEMWNRARRTAAADESFGLDFETIATRGEHLVLFRLRIRRDVADFESLQISRYDDGWLSDLVVRFDVDQVGEAVAELERLYQEELGDSVEAIQLREFSRGMALLAAGDVDGFVALHHAAFVMRDHRQLGWPDLDLDGYRERLESIMAIEGEVLVFQERLLRLDHTASTCAPQRIVFTAPDGTQQISRSVMVMVMGPHTGLITRMEQFDEDQVDEALARFDALITKRGNVLHNEVSRRASFVNAWVRRGDDELVVGSVSSGATFVGSNGEPFELSPVERREVMAVRGDRLALVHLTGPGQAFAVEEVDETWRLSSVRRFGTDQLGEAVACLEIRWIEIEGAALSAAARIGAMYRAAMNRHEVERLDALLADDHEVVDRRPMGWPRLSRDEVLRLSAPDAVGVPGGLVVSELLEIRDDGTVARVSMLVVDADGSATRDFNALGVTRVRDGRVSKVEFFAEDDVEAAVRCLDELTADSSAAPDHWNEADRLSWCLHEAFLGRSSESWSDLVDPDTVSDHRRPLVGYRTEGWDAPVELWAGEAAAAEIDPPSMSMETIAARGEQLVLQRIAVETDIGDGGGVIQLLRWNERGLNDLLVRFDLDQLVEAMAELDRLWFASLNPRQRQVGRLAVALGEAWVAPSTHPFDELLAPEFEFVDGRTLGMGSLDRAAFEQALQGREDDGATGPPVPSRIAFVSDDVMVFRAHNVGVAPETGLDWEEIACNVLVVDGDRISRLEMFDEDEWDGAITRARYVAAARSRYGRLEKCRDWLDGPERPRGVGSSSGRLRRRLRPGEPSDHDRRRSGKRRRPGAGLPAFHEMRPTSTVQPAIEIRGERFALVPISVEIEGSVIESLIVSEVDAGPRVPHRPVRPADDGSAGSSTGSRRRSPPERSPAMISTCWLVRRSNSPTMQSPTCEPRRVTCSRRRAPATSPSSNDRRGAHRARHGAAFAG